MSLRIALILVFTAVVLLVAAWPYIGQTEPTIDPSAFQPVVVPQPIIPPPPYIPEPIPDIGTSPAPPLVPPTQPDNANPSGAAGSCYNGVCPTSEPSDDGVYYRRGLLRRWR